MGQGPFAKRNVVLGAPTERRQSTHVNHLAPIVISGRDASGQPFREATETFSVSFHGAALRTRNQVLIGTQLSVECLLTGGVAKAICVRIFDAAAGQEPHAIAVQLLIPSNIWGVRNPPADWRSGTETSPPRAPAARTAFPSSQSAPPAKTQPPAAAPAPVAGPDLEQRSADLAESVLQLLRSQAAGILRESLKVYEERLKFLESGVEARIIQSAEKNIADAGARVSNQAAKSVDDAEIALAGLRRDLMEQLGERTERVIASAEATLREKIEALVKEHLKSEK